jgi:cell division protein FtsL
MTTMTEPNQLWSAMPGWGIFADLTPPELTAARRLSVLRKVIVTALVVVIVLCAAGVVFASRQKSSATTSLGRQQIQTSRLNSRISSFSGLTKLQGTVTQVKAQVTAAMAGDVTFPKFVGEVRAALPGTMTIQDLGLTISAAAVNANGAANTAAAAVGLDKSGKPVIGQVTLTGTGPTFDALSSYVDALSKISGIVNVVPTSSTTNAEHGSQIQYNLTFSVTDEVLSHRFDTAPSGGK